MRRSVPLITVGVAAAAVLTASVICSGIGLSSSIASPRVVEAATIADSQIVETDAVVSLSRADRGLGRQRPLAPGLVVDDRPRVSEGDASTPRFRGSPKRARASG